MYLQWFSIRLLVIVVVLVPRPYVHDLATRIALKPGKGTVFFFVLTPPRVQTVFIASPGEQFDSCDCCYRRKQGPHRRIVTNLDIRSSFSYIRLLLV